MAASASNPDPDVLRLAEAAAWRVRLTEAGRESSPEFELWLDRDPANGEAWRHAQELWFGLGDLATAPELLAARRDALERARRAASAPWRARRGGRVWMAAAAAAVLAVLVGGGLGWRAMQPDRYETARSERRVVGLADGSRITLDSDSRVDVRYGRHGRDLTLRRGQARFDVAHDVTRPFKVRALTQTVVATGTAFNVELLGPKVRVTLIEGRVTVLGDGATQSASPGTPQSVPLAAGQRLTAVASAAAPPHVEPVDLDRATAWESGKLVFDNEPLSAVAEQVSRYTPTPVAVGDPRAAALRISGVFTAGDLATFVDTVTRYLPVDSEVRGDGAVVLRSRG